MKRTRPSPTCRACTDRPNTDHTHGKGCRYAFELDGSDDQAEPAPAPRPTQPAMFTAPEVLKGQHAFAFSAPQLEHQAEDDADPAPSASRESRK